MLKHIKSHIAYLRSLIFPLFALFPSETQERVNVDFYWELLSRKCLLHIINFETHGFTYTENFVIFRVCRDGIL